MLEGSVVTLASARVNPQHLERVKASLESMREDGLNGRAQIENDRRFHIAIAEMTGNSVFVRLGGELFDDRHSPISSRMRNRRCLRRADDGGLAEAGRARLSTASECSA